MFGCSDVYHWMGRAAKAVCVRVGQMRSLLIVAQMRPDSLSHTITSGRSFMSNQ